MPCMCGAEDCPSCYPHLLNRSRDDFEEPEPPEPLHDNEWNIRGVKMAPNEQGGYDEPNGWP